MRLKSGEDMRLRTMCPEDCTLVALLQAQLDFSGWSELQWIEALGYYPCAWVLESSNSIVGYVIYQTRVPQVELLNIGIAPEHQNRGLAAGLLSATMELLPETSEAVFLEVRRSNLAAIGLYTKLDFQPVGERRDYYPVAGGGREDALIYRVELPRR